MKIKIIVPIFALLVFIAACVTTPESGKQAFILMSLSEEANLGNQAFGEILKKEKESTNTRLVAITKRVGERLARNTTMPDLEWEFKLFESDQMNAFALPGGKTAAYTGLLQVCENEAALAAVMGHEIAHVTARHGAQRMTQQKAISIGMQMATGLAGPGGGMIMGALGVGVQYGVTLPFSRSNESEADQIGLAYMAKAGYDPREAVRFWTRFSKMKQGSKQPPEFLSTHPADATRIANLNRFLPRALAQYKNAKTQYGLGETFVKK
ncbi:Zn-dependent protease with chaperone function PA4632 [hydrothermal vent metagenome]|uniref:Zn-dependent protease with chaperone function PA4632 n=1 Tax=hydrothermal vent metagenome TaxID=652676 RepID=A0A3B1D5E3_9ZZZZ